MLTAPARRAIINSMSPLSVPAGTAIITQGDAEATRFFVLASGRATVHIADAKTGTRKQVATYNPARFASAAARWQAMRGTSLLPWRREGLAACCAVQGTYYEGAVPLFWTCCFVT